MHLIWKRPDGFHKANPEDFMVVDTASNARIWLHKTDHENYPFRVSGGWEDETQTRRINQLVNLLKTSEEFWKNHLVLIFGDAKQENYESFIQNLIQWLTELKACSKGDTWEKEIMGVILDEVARKIQITAQ